MATLDRQDPEYLYVALVDATGPRRMEGVDFHTGTFPDGLSWKATEEAEAGLDPRSWTRCRFGYAASARVADLAAS